MKRSKGIDLEVMVTSGPDSAYEALQLYKSKINRLRVKSNYFDALEVCKTSGVILLRNGYESAGDEIGKLFVEILDEINLDLTPESRNLLNILDSAYSPHSISRRHFLKECLKYSVRTGQRIYGDTLLHGKLAENLWLADEKSESLKHFALGEIPEILVANV
jgi:hypothetical protein